MADMQAEIERAKLDFICGELAELLPAELAGAEICFESDSCRNALYVFYYKRHPHPPLTRRAPRKT